MQQLNESRLSSLFTNEKDGTNPEILKFTRSLIGRDHLNSEEKEDIFPPL